MSKEAYDEAQAGKKNIEERKKKAHGYIYARDHDGLGGEEEDRKKLREILFHSTCLREAQKKDVRILFCAKIAGAILITKEGKSKRQPGGMLGHAKELASLGITVVTDEVAVQKVKHRIFWRDKTARSVARDTGLPLPPWVGQD